MKKQLIPILVLVLLLAGCKKDSPKTTPQTTETFEIQLTEPEEIGPSDLDIAAACIGGIAEDLISQLGEPISREYYPSQRESDDLEAQEGILYYSKFIVYTYKEGNTEWIEDVEDLSLVDPTEATSITGTSVTTESTESTEA